MSGMTVRKINSLIAALAVVLFLLPASASASVITYNLAADWDDTTCTGKINERTGVITPYYVAAGSDISISLKNQSSLDLSVVFAVTDGEAVTKVVAAGDTDSESYPNFQGSISITPSPVSTTCSGDQTEPGPASISIIAKAPASATLPTADTPPPALPTTTTQSATTPTTTKTPASKTPSKQTFGIQKGPELNKTITGSNASAKAPSNATLGLFFLVVFLLLGGGAFVVLRRRASKKIPAVSTGTAALHPKLKR
ncbi:MAG: hypothetical protein JWM81_843 [Candidatus Saccharibacteria bacterium]|nr:hypothetical protein [Candidatus Saccharibacteria bacterium]